MTARYRANAPLYVQRLIHPGEEFASDLPPGRNWEPLNDDAREACARRDAERGTINATAAKLDPPVSMAGSVEIPANWESLSVPKRRALAMKLGAQSNVKLADAETYITAELERRSQKAAA